VKSRGIIAAIAVLVALSGCSRDRGETEIDQAAKTGMVPVRFAALPVVDSLPLFVAQSEGIFAGNGIRVEVIPVASPVERDQLFQAGEIDGMLNELSSTAIFNSHGIQIRTVLTARVPTADSPVFRILASPGTGIHSTSDLAGRSIAVSMNTIIEYLTERMLSEEGVSDVNLISVPVIPERFQLLLAGDVDAATLPDPLAQAAIKAGAVPVVDDSHHQAYSVSVISFRNDFDDRTIVGFVDAWTEAAVLLNAEPAKFRPVLLESIPVPDSVRDEYRIPQFPIGQIPSASQWDDVISWLRDKGIIDTAPAYEDSIVSGFIE